MNDDILYFCRYNNLQTCKISRTLVDKTIVYHPDVVGALLILDVLVHTLYKILA